MDVLKDFIRMITGMPDNAPVPTLAIVIVIGFLIFLFFILLTVELQ